jgi:hypothetical protein
MCSDDDWYIREMTLMTVLVDHPMWDGSNSRSSLLKLHRERVPAIKCDHPAIRDGCRSSGDMKILAN